MIKDNSPQPKNAAKTGVVIGHPGFKLSAASLICLALSPWLAGCHHDKQTTSYPIDPAKVVKTTQRMVSFAYEPPVNIPSVGVMPDPADPPQSPNGGNALTWSELNQTNRYDELGYGQWHYLEVGLPIQSRTDLMPAGYQAGAVTQGSKLLNFIAMTDIHLTDKEAPNQLIFMQQNNPGNAGQNTSIYSPVMNFSSQVFDAAIQTVNVLNKQDPLDFVISLGDVSNNSMYNELRWYLDVLDGKPIRPSSGEHKGEESVDFQRPFQAAGLDSTEHPLRFWGATCLLAFQ